MKYSRDSAIGRSIATAKQVIVALLASLPALDLLLNDEQFKTLIVSYFPKLAPALVVLTACVTFITNYMRKDVPNR